MARRRKALSTAALALALSLAAAGCSSSGGKKTEQKDATAGVSGVNTPKLTIAMVTHSGAGDTFWDIVQRGAQQAAAKDNVKFLYSNNQEGNEQAQLVQTAIDQKVDGIIVTLAKPDALKAVIQKAVQAGIPVISINSGSQFSAAYGALSHIGQDEAVAGEAVGDELTKRGLKKALCVIHEQGNVSLEQRCDGAAKTFKGSMQKLYVTGTNMPDVLSSVTSKLQADKSIDAVLALGAPFAATSVQAVKQTGAKVEVDTFDLNAAVVKQLKSKEVGFAVDQQPYLQGYLAVDELWLYKTNGDVIGGGKPVLTGPALVTDKDVAQLEKYTERGTR
ncbi:sugar ABC transporter substrate-binding protein [Streptomyces sp. H10-C2]|uniref:sugar ABC transporter substrate-binding protein n=1 Tax=unclassified Streptomyces TaxID=2593676 RepID=UPI0024BB4EA0|nr:MULTISPECIES: sugar ABC transporter substrate-binding protein [unclassified Streptomyces]MDJ0340809.1 sugar ABC transporter substrate-binding protein [Streptomyces sp. PH10-H1]MDJ0371649.1 sugar ABC transporter substrate-binding protein [Streptomyces sp. H10-C2]